MKKPTEAENRKRYDSGKIKLIAIVRADIEDDKQINPTGERRAFNALVRASEKYVEQLKRAGDQDDDEPVETYQELISRIEEVAESARAAAKAVKRKKTALPNAARGVLILMRLCGFPPALLSEKSEAVRELADVYEQARRGSVTDMSLSTVTYRHALSKALKKLDDPYDGDGRDWPEIFK